MGYGPVSSAPVWRVVAVVSVYDTITRKTRSPAEVPSNRTLDSFDPAMAVPGHAQLPAKLSIGILATTWRDCGSPCLSKRYRDPLDRCQEWVVAKALTESVLLPIMISEDNWRCQTVPLRLKKLPP